LQTISRPHRLVNICRNIITDLRPSSASSRTIRQIHVVNIHAIVLIRTGNSPCDESTELICVKVLVDKSHIANSRNPIKNLMRHNHSLDYHLEYNHDYWLQVHRHHIFRDNDCGQYEPRCISRYRSWLLHAFLSSHEDVISRADNVCVASNS
jgi:hypothetical protein